MKADQNRTPPRARAQTDLQNYGSNRQAEHSRSRSQTQLQRSSTSHTPPQTKSPEKGKKRRLSSLGVSISRLLAFLCLRFIGLFWTLQSETGCDPTSYCPEAAYTTINIPADPAI